MTECTHDKRFNGVFDLPKGCNGCVACYSELLATNLNKSEKVLDDLWDIITSNEDPGIRIMRTTDRLRQTRTDDI